MKPIRSILQRHSRAATCLALAALGVSALQAQQAAPQQGITVFGSLANFDVYNDTGQDAYGFQIELDGLAPQQVIGTFPQSRYGAPSIVPFAGGVYVRYEAKWDPVSLTFTAATTTPAAFAPTMGHSCVLTFVSGCDHYGIVTSGGASNTVMQWLVADPANPGTLITYSGPPVSIPVPVVTVAPPAQPNLQPVVEFQVQVPDPPAVQWGEPRWVKVYKTELQREVALGELLGGNPVVPEDAAHIETAWKMLQKNPHSPNSNTLHSGGNIAVGSHAVVRRYEFYKYIGKRDPLTGEALCIDPTCATADPSEVGDYIGDQMAAANVGVPSITVTKTGTGTVTGANGKINCGGTCSTVVVAGTSVTLTANPGGSVFSGWTGACAGLNLNCTVVVNDAATVNAAFTPMHTLSIGHASGGTVTGNPAGVQHTAISCGSSCSAKFAEGTVVTLTATPTTGTFTGWSGACAGTDPVCTITMSKDLQVQAAFK